VVKEEKIDEKAVLAAVKALKEEISTKISQSQFLLALKAAIAEPPVTKSEDTKKLAADAVGAALAALPAADVDKTIDGCSAEELNTILKYVYKCMATGQNCAVLLKWHEKLVDKCGLGIVMRAMVDRKI